MTCISISKDEIERLKDSDKILSKLIDLIGDIETPIRSNYFESLVHSILSQMLSSKVAAIIKHRLQEITSNEITPAKLLSLDDATLRSIGISFSKIKSIKDLSTKTESQDILWDKLHQLPNDEVIKNLTTVKGIGKWTAEMFLIFSLGRKDVISLGDIGLQRSALWLYQQYYPTESDECLKNRSQHWKPYRSIASLYLWRAIDDGYVDSGYMLDK